VLGREKPRLLRSSLEGEDSGGPMEAQFKGAGSAEQGEKESVTLENSPTIAIQKNDLLKGFRVS